MKQIAELSREDFIEFLADDYCRRAGYDEVGAEERKLLEARANFVDAEIERETESNEIVEEIEREIEKIRKEEQEERSKKKNRRKIPGP